MDKVGNIFKNNLKFNIIVLVISIVLIVIFTGMTGYNKIKKNNDKNEKNRSEKNLNNTLSREDFENDEFSSAFTDSIQGNTRNFIHTYSKTFFLKALIAVYGYGLTHPVASPKLSKVSRKIFNGAGIKDESNLFANMSNLLKNFI